jgi:hypothetical protein
MSKSDSKTLGLLFFVCLGICFSLLYYYFAVLKFELRACILSYFTHSFL